jgi:hypothetical protein
VPPLIQISAPGLQCGANAGVMASNNLRRDIVVILSIKITIVLIAALFVFGPRQRPQIDGDAIQHQILNNSDR